jgi:putative membrane protein
MKRIIRNFFIVLLSLYFVTQVAQGLVFEKGIETFLITAAVLTVTMMFGKPVINLLLLPLNLITFGVFRWVSSAVSMYIVTLIVKEFRVERFYFEGIVSKWVEIPKLDLKGILAYIAFSFLLSFSMSFLHWVRK